MLVFVEDSAEALLSSYVQAGDLLWVGDRWGQWTEWAGVGDALVRSVSVIAAFELAQGVEQVALVPDQGPVQQFAAAGLIG
ncbi:MAG: Transposase [Actinomycetia bacterium]|nr:Transposase [Actinomycetes bacterium]